MSLSASMGRVAKALRGWRFPFEDEKACQNAIEPVLRRSLLIVEREVPISGGVIDFMAGAIGIEVKLKGNAGAIRRQLRRYAEDKRIAALVLVTAKPVGIGKEIGGKPVLEFNMGAAWL